MESNSDLANKKYYCVCLDRNGCVRRNVLSLTKTYQQSTELSSQQAVKVAVLSKYEDFISEVLKDSASVMSLTEEEDHD
ncbi:hypothetical protein TNCV_4271011 [Trichonephila clavipes]|nr:hypothetical protein TNCV_4271011 [Trichonephila clavipes]